MKVTNVKMGDGNHKMFYGSFTNVEYKKEWDEFVPGTKVLYKEGTYVSDDGNDFAVYDGATNYLGRVNKETGEISYNGSESEYNKTFLESAKKEICK